MVNETLMFEIANMTSELSPPEDHGELSQLDAVNPSAVFCVFVVVIAVFTIIWTPVWVFCKCEDGEKEPRGYQEGAYQAYADGNFVDVDLSIEIDDSKSDYIDEDMAGSSSGEAKYSTDSSNYHSGSSLILDAADLMNRVPATDFEFKLLPSSSDSSTGKPTFLRNLKKFIKSVVCRSQSVTFVDRYSNEEVQSGIFHDLSEDGPARDSAMGDSCSSINPRDAPSAYLKRSLSLPTRLRTTTRMNTFRDANEMVPLWIEISTTEEIVDDEASALCSAVILKSLEMQGYFSRMGALDFPSIKIAEFNVTEKTREDELVREYLFRVQVPKKISQILTRERSRGRGASDRTPEISRMSRVRYKKYLPAEAGEDGHPKTPLPAARSAENVFERTKNFSQNPEENFMKAILVIYNPPPTHDGDNGRFEVGTTALARWGSTISSP